MPSIVVSNTVAFDPYKAKVVDAPVMGSFADMWGVRQESDIILEDGMQKRHQPESALQQDDIDHTIRVLQHNPYSLTNPLTEVYTCTCGHCNLPLPHSKAAADSSLIDPHYVTEDVLEESAVSRFMPPPPPRVDTYDVIAACGAVDPDTVVYQMMMRWYGKVLKSQVQFDVDAACPSPSPSEYTFSEWCTMVNDWWYRNFEHRQKKQHRPAPVHQSHW